MTAEGSAQEWRVKLAGALLGLAVIAVMLMVSYFVDLTVPATVGILVTVVVIAFIAYVGREEYRIARNDGMGRLRAVARSGRRTIDMFVMGK